MRTQLTVAALAMAAAAAPVATRAATGPTARTTRPAAAPAAASRAAARAALLAADPDIAIGDLLAADPVTDDPYYVDPFAEPAHDHATHDHATHTHAARPVSRIAPTGRWRTPEAAMRHLARAYNARDVEALKDVTTPGARNELLGMRATYGDLRLTTCYADSGGFVCNFTHAIKGSTERGGASIAVMPAAKQGWYARGLLGCG
jgi:hypothetical protein